MVQQTLMSHGLSTHEHFHARLGHVPRDQRPLLRTELFLPWSPRLARSLQCLQPRGSPNSLPSVPIRPINPICGSPRSIRGSGAARVENTTSPLPRLRLARLPRPPTWSWEIAPFHPDQINSIRLQDQRQHICPFQPFWFLPAEERPPSSDGVGLKERVCLAPQSL